MSFAPAPSERDLYPVVQKALTEYLRQGDDQIAIMLDITADEFPQRSEALLQRESRGKKPGNLLKKIIEMTPEKLDRLTFERGSAAR